MEHDPSRDDVFVLNDPFAGGTHLPDITLVSRTEVGFAVTRAHHADVGGAEPGLDARAVAHAGGGGRRHPADPARRATLEALVAQMRNPEERRGDFRAQLAAHRLADSGSPSSAPGTAPTASARRWTSCSPTRSGSSAPGSRACPTAATRPRTSSRPPKETSSFAPPSLSPATSSSRLRRHGAAARREPQLPALGHALGDCYFVVRCLTDPDVPASAGAFAPVRSPRRRARSSTRSAGAAVAGGNVETSCRIVDVLFRAFGRRCPGAGPGPGDDEQPHARQRAVHVLRDARRRPGRVPRRRRALGRARDDVEHAHDAGRGARARLPAAGSPPRAAARLRRRRPSTAAATASSASSRRSSRAAPRSSASAGATRPAGAEGGEPGAAGRNLLNGEELPARRRRPRAGRRPPHRNARRRRMGR